MEWGGKCRDHTNHDASINDSEHTEVSAILSLYGSGVAPRNIVAGLEQNPHNLGVLYADQGKLDEAEKMCQRALQGKEKAWGPDHASTLATVNNLGSQPQSLQIPAQAG
jgi:tetratricopeptide repeat protein